jgi:hypothetical protein
MFDSASTFNQDLSAFDVSSVTDISFMFRTAVAFNQNLCSWGQKVPASDFFFLRMFLDSGCPITDDPDSSDLSAGPWCYDCSLSTTAPTSAPSFPPTAAPAFLSISAPTSVLAPTPTSASASPVLLAPIFVFSLFAEFLF